MNGKVGSRDLDDEIVDAEPEVIKLSDCEEKLVNTRKAVKAVVKTEKSGTGPVAHCPTADRIHADLMRSRARNHSQDLLANISQPNLRRARADDQSVNALQTGQIFMLSSQVREAQRQAEALKNHFHQEIYYAGGGCSTQFLGSDDDDVEIQGRNDSPGTRCYTFEDNDQPSSSSSSLPTPSFSLPTSSSSLLTSELSLQDGPHVVLPKMGRKITTPVSAIGSPIRYPSLEV